ncbi:glutaredoxin family protein [Methylocaldum sp.]|uniref:glutaredoxin family protein n=1 Tax=Methylocaldum sp. TaxID=1969727 RepID=UPI002D4BC386|nr:glutaredoxin family protein [Methylocaldum sp.]HYE36297.1 glutaredoxin family protein [Methylocaldum sp.]
MIRLILYGTYGCHLCEDAEILLSEAVRTRHLQIPVEIVDIAENRELEDRYGVRIPVVLDPVSGVELGWPFDAERLSEFLQDLS